MFPKSNTSQEAGECCPVCGKHGSVISNMRASNGRLVTCYICYPCNITWDDPPSTGGSSSYGSKADPFGDDGASGGSLDTLIKR